MLGEINGESVKSAIARRLIECFTVHEGWDAVPPIVYKERIIQCFEKPSFFIWTLNTTQKKLMRNNYERVYSMNIKYHPKEDDLNIYENLDSIGEKALRCLETITLPTYYKGGEIPLPVRGINLDFKIIQDVLNIFVEYVIRGFKTSEINETKIQGFTMNNSLKGV